MHNLECKCCIQLVNDHTAKAQSTIGLGLQMITFSLQTVMSGVQMRVRSVNDHVRSMNSHVRFSDVGLAN